MKTRLSTVSATLVVWCLGATAALAQSDHIMATPDELKWIDVPSLPAGAKVAVIEGPLSEAVPFTFRVRFPANYQIPAHWHPATERVTVLSGTLNIGMGDKLDPQKTTALGPGSIVIMQPGTKHFAWTKEETSVQFNGSKRPVKALFPEVF